MADVTEDEQKIGSARLVARADEWRGGDEEQPTPEFITGALSLFVRREDSGVTLGAAKRLIGDYLTNPAKVDELTTRLQCFRLACALERLKRAGLYEEVFCGDPFDPDAEVEVKLTNEDVEFFNSQPSQEEVRVHVQRRFGMH